MKGLRLFPIKSSRKSMMTIRVCLIVCQSISVVSPSAWWIERNGRIRVDVIKQNQLGTRLCPGYSCLYYTRSMTYVQTPTKSNRSKRERFYCLASAIYNTGKIRYDTTETVAFWIISDNLKTCIGCLDLSHGASIIQT